MCSGSRTSTPISPVLEATRAATGTREGNSWLPFTARKEIIRRKKNPALELIFYENDHGVLYGDPFQPGHYLATRWSCRDQTSAATFNAAL